MNPISLAMDGLLAVLLLTAVAVGVRLNGKLKVLRESQTGFVKAVGDLDLAAARAESGLSALRAATQEAHDQLLTRIDTARTLAARLDRAAEDAQSASARLEEGVRGAETAMRRAQAAGETASRIAAERASAPPVAAPALTPAPAPAPAALRAGFAEPVIRAALLAAERIVEAEETGTTRPAAPPPAAPTRPAPPLAVPTRVPPPGPVGDRLARFVARRQGGRG